MNHDHNNNVTMSVFMHEPGYDYTEDRNYNNGDYRNSCCS